LDYYKSLPLIHVNSNSGEAKGADVTSEFAYLPVLKVRSKQGCSHQNLM